jgi:hypothetical protein
MEDFPNDGLLIWDAIRERASPCLGLQLCLFAFSVFEFLEKLVND